MRPYKHLIFDLDDTLFDTWGQLVAVALEEACQKMINKGLNTDLRSAVAFRKKLYEHKPRCNFWKELAQEFGTSSEHSLDELSSMGNDAFHNRQVNEDICLFPGVYDMLNELHHTYDLHLVTAGNFNTQNQKIQLLDIAILFNDIYCVDTSKGQSKKDAFTKILKLNHCEPSEFLCIGNRLDQEIRMAKELKMDTCYVRYGEYVNMQPSCEAEKPDFTIELIANLTHILEMSTDDLNDLRRA